MRGSFGWRLSCSWRDFTQTGIWLGVDCIVVFVGIGIQVFCWMLGEGCSVGRINGSFFKDSVFVLDVVQFPWRLPPDSNDHTSNSKYKKHESLLCCLGLRMSVLEYTSVVGFN